MVSQCANPKCRVPFLYFSEGKLIALKLHSASLARERVELFWLCAACCNDMTVGIPAQGAHLQPRLKVVCLSDYQRSADTSSHAISASLERSA
jgi:hypothetical protein